MDETQEKCVIEGDGKEKIGNAIDQLDLLHRLFIDHGDYGGVIPERRAGRVAAGGLPTTLTRLSGYAL
jgi:hypothetical protein